MAKWQYPLFPVGWLLKDRFEVLSAWERFTGAAWALFAGKDEIIPAGTAKEFQKSAGPNKQVRVIPGFQNSGIVLQEEDWWQFLKADCVTSPLLGWQEPHLSLAV